MNIEQGMSNVEIGCSLRTSLFLVQYSIFFSEFSFIRLL